MSSLASVSGKLVLPDGAAPPSGSFVQLDLKNYGNSQPQADGVVVYPQRQFTLSSVDGSWSGSLYRNDFINCNGTFPTYWAVTYFSIGGAVYPAKFVSIAQTSVDVDSLPALNPVVTNIPLLPPGTGGESAFATFAVPASVWTIVHGFGTQAVDATFYDLSWNEIVPSTRVSTNVNTFTAAFSSPQAGYAVVMNVGNWTPSISNPNYIIQNPISSQGITGDYPFTIGGSLSVKRIEGIRYADQFPGATIDAQILAAMNDLPATGGVVDARSLSGTFGSTLTWPHKRIDLLLDGVYTGPAIGSMLVIDDYRANGSRVLGSGYTSILQANQGNGTTLISNASNTSDLFRIASGTSVQAIQGFQVSDLNLDGASSAVNILSLDAVKSSTFRNLNLQNCTGVALKMYVTNTNGANQGTQFNTFYNIQGGNGCPQAITLNGNSNASSDCTLNKFYGINMSFSSASLPGIEFIQGDGNEFYGVHLQATAGSYTGACVQFDAPDGTHVGGLNNKIHGFHPYFSGSGTCVKAKAGSYGNYVQINAIENVADPVIENTAVLMFDIDKANLRSNRQLGPYTTVSWASPTGTVGETALGRSNPQAVNLGKIVSGAADSSGSLFLSGIGLSGGTVLTGQTGTGTSIVTDTGSNLITPKIGGGTTLTRYARYSVTLSPASVAANTTAEQSFATSVTSGDVIVGVSKPTAQAGLGIVGWRASGTTLFITFANNTASPIVPTGSESYAVIAVQ